MQKITLTNSTRECIAKDTFLGYEGENEVNKLVFEFTDGFKDGLGVLNIQRGDEYGYVSLEKVETTYEFPVKSSILSKVGDIKFQVVITGNDGSVIKYDPFTMTVKDAIDAQGEMPEEYPSWVDMANAKLAEVDEAIRNTETATKQAESVAEELLKAKENGEFDGEDGVVGRDGVSPTVETQQTETGAKIVITDVEGTHEVEVFNGKDGTMKFEDLTEEQKASLKGDKGDKGEKGETGETGATGADGKDGANGADGFSPSAKVTQTETGATITITDKDGTTTAEIKNGKDGEGGTGGTGSGVGQAGTGTNAEIFNDYTGNTASGTYSHAEGEGSTATGYCSHAEGYKTQATDNSAHAEGRQAKAQNTATHAEGSSTLAKGYAAHAEGEGTSAYSDNSHAEGKGTSAKGVSQHVQGRYNIVDTGGTTSKGKYLHIVGNGTSDSARSNAHTLDWDGVGWYATKVMVGGKSQDDTTAKELATTEYVDNAVANAGGGIAELPIATTDTLGGIKVGDGLGITEDGILSVVGGSGGRTFGKWTVAGSSNPDGVSAMPATPNELNTMESSESGNPIFKAGKTYMASAFVNAVNYSTTGGRLSLSIEVDSTSYGLAYILPVNLNYGTTPTMMYLPFIGGYDEDKEGFIKGVVSGTVSKDVTGYTIDILIEELSGNDGGASGDGITLEEMQNYVDNAIGGALNGSY